MDRKRILPRLCFLMAVVLTVLGVALRTVCMFTHYDAALGYFDRGVLPTIGSILYYIAILAAAIGALLIPRGALSGDCLTPHRAPFAYATGLGFAAYAVLSLITAYATLFTAGGWMTTALTLSALLAATYFLLSASHHGQFRDGLLWLSFLPIVWCLLAIAVTYSDPYMPMNSPIKLSLQMGLLGFMLIMTSEIRYRLGRALPRGAVALTSIGVYLALNAALPLVVAGVKITDPLYRLCAGVLLVAGVYGGYMLFCYTHCPVDARADDESDASDTAL